MPDKVLTPEQELLADLTWLLGGWDDRHDDALPVAHHKIDGIVEQLKALRAERDAALAHSSGRCAYCGKEFGQNDEAAKEHISICEKHPLAAALVREKALRAAYGYQAQTWHERLHQLDKPPYQRDYRDCPFSDCIEARERIIALAAAPAEEVKDA